MGKYSRAIIVGAGPAGSACAIALHRLGFPEVEIVERQTVFREKPCAGGITPRALGVLKRLDVKHALGSDPIEIRGARVFGPDCRELKISIGKAARVVRRAPFDSILLDEAQSLGATLTRGFAADRLLHDDGVVVGVGAGDQEKEADIVVIATGARSRLCWDPRPRLKVDAVITRYEGVDASDRHLYLFFHQATIPHYAWLFPEPGGTVSVGLSQEPGRAQGSLTKTLDSIAEECFPQLRGARRIERVRGHPIVFTGLGRHLVKPGAVCIGEAGRLTDAFTGEGIWHALRSASEAATAIVSGDLALYERRSRFVLDPALAAAEATRRMAGAQLFCRFYALSPWKPVAWVTGKVLMGLGG